MAEILLFIEDIISAMWGDQQDNSTRITFLIHQTCSSYIYSWCWALFWRPSPMLPAGGFYTSPTFSCFSYHWNKIFRVIDEYIMRTMKSYCGVIVDALSTRTPFYGIICDDHIWCQRGHIFSIEMVTPCRGIGNLFNWNKISMIKAKIPIMYTYNLSILKNSPYNCVRWTKSMGLLRRKRTSKEIIIHTVTLQLSLSGEYMHLI